MSKNILLLVTGMSPAIVTETLYGLAVRPEAGQQPWIPDAVHVISTTSGLTQIRANLFVNKEHEGYFARLLADYGLPPIHFDESCLHPICDAAGQPLADLKTPLDNELAANAICEKVRHFTTDPDSTLHVSIAGGRKTMGFYAGYALSLFGRPQDRMSHVLVSEAFETLRDFYYPAPAPRVAYATAKDGRSLDAFDAQVWLADIPFVRLRSSLNKHTLVDKATFSEVVAAINMANQPIHLKIYQKKRIIQVGNIQCKLSPRDFAFYLWFAQRAINHELPYKRPVEQENRRMPDLWALWKGKGTIDPLDKKSGCLTKENFEQALAAIKKNLALSFGHSILTQINIANNAEGDFLPLNPEQIEMMEEKK